jgi:hypothetical protein
MKTATILILLGATNAFVTPSGCQRQAQSSALFSANANDDFLASRRSVLAGSLAGAVAFVPLVASAKVRTQGGYISI